MTNIKSSFQAYKKVALSNSSNFRYKVIYLYCVIIKNAKRKLEYDYFNSLNANPTKWSNRLKQFVGKSRGIV